MSLILDALRKLDREKSIRRSRTANIAVDILSPDRPRPGKRMLVYFAAASLTAVAAAAVTYGVMTGFDFLSKSSPPELVNPGQPGQRVELAPLESGPPPKSSPPAPLIPPAPSQQAASAPPESGSVAKASPPGPASPPESGQKLASARVESGPLPKSSPPAPLSPPAPSQQVLPPPLSREPVRSAQEETRREPPKIQTPAESKSPTASPVEQKASAKVISQEAVVAPGSTQKAAEQTANASAAAPPPLKISGIVWHEEPSKRRAVVNGTFTNEGSLIEGVKVEEIYPTRVRFSHNGRPFEISIFE